MITTEQIKELRDKTGVSIMQCRKALEEAQGDMDKAMAILREKSSEIAAKKSDRELGAGMIQAYVHSSGTMGALLELNCETDFVAKNPEFKTLAYDLAMQVAAAGAENLDDLLAQEFIKDPSMTVTTLVQSFVQKFGEKIVIGKFSRLSVLGR